EGPRHPLILLSHGFGGTASDLAWLGTALAAHGFIAVAVNHPGHNALEAYTVEGYSLMWLGAVDLGAVIDAVLNDKTFGNRIDPARIGAAGHSLGGYTVVADPGFLPLIRSRRVVRTAAGHFTHAAKELGTPELRSQFPPTPRRSRQFLS